MLSGILSMLILLGGIHWIMAVNMCTNGSTATTDVTLNLINGTGVNGCICTVKLRNPDKLGSVKPKIIFEVVQFSGCKYRLVICYNNSSPVLSCSNKNFVFHNINKTDEINLYLESTSSQDDTEFQIRITLSVTAPGGSLIRLDCFAPSVALTSTSTSSQTVTQQTTSIATSTPYTEPIRDTTTTQLSTASSTNTMMNSQGSSAKQDGVCGCDDDDNVTAGIIGGVIGMIIGVVGSIVVVIIIRIMKKRKKNSTSEIYSSPSPQQHQPESIYTDLQLS